jgi:hypothetical protein
MEYSDEAKLAVVTLQVTMATTPPDARVEMGCALFSYCRQRGLVTMDEFTPLGPGSRPQALPAYLHKNIVLAAPELGDWEYRIDA